MKVIDKDSNFIFFLLHFFFTYWLGNFPKKGCDNSSSEFKQQRKKDACKY